MPIKKAAMKALRQAKKRVARNTNIKNNIKTLIKNARKTIGDKNKDAAAKLVHDAMKSLDKAVQKGIVKKNTAARKKSRLQKRLNTILK